MESRIHPTIQGDEAHVMMMKSPDHWPDTGVSVVVFDGEGARVAGELPKSSALLALTRGRELGVMASRSEHRFSVFTVILYDARIKSYLETGEPGDMPRIDYSSAEEAYADGWRVD